ncbi:MAG: hypothetical protein KFW09_06255 [Oscillospiraceae bacterium]|nr:hypothetical protein [Oscillospiraceae bacterium]
MIFTNKSKRAISLALSFLICFTLALPAYAKSTTQTDDLNLEKSILIKSGEHNSLISSRRMGIVRVFVNAEDNVTKGFKFVIEGNGIKKEHTTGDDGAIYFTEIPVGVYTIRQLETGDRYVETLKKEVSVESNRTTNIIFENLAKRSNVIGNIIDNSGNNIGGATVSLYKKTNLIKPIDTKISLSNGSFEFSNIQYGDYIIKTSGTSNNFSHSDKEIQVRKDGGYTNIGNISSKDIIGRVIGKNISVDNESLGISGGVIGLYKYIDSFKKRSVHISSVTVDINGNFSFDNIPEGEYYLRDLAPGQGYDTIFRDYDFKIDKPNQVIEMILKSKPLVDDIIIGKNKLNQENKQGLTVDENISGINLISDEIVDVENQSLDVINLKQEEINSNNLIDNNHLKNLSNIELGYKNNVNTPVNNKLGMWLTIFLISIASTGLGIVFIKKYLNKYKFKK